ncbi:hypothetical protein H6P81_018415 [Aristolochia fimbriata]|uniref:Uncharacterized protein n=1 Tax=Aristolochia fimbriata TaxID=158543 RepID=A0AAV7E474_ARIFI|nr:hypothetical protein H6P81_018415 [Aristolochia fimbriata]
MPGLLSSFRLSRSSPRSHSSRESSSAFGVHFGFWVTCLTFSFCSDSRRDLLALLPDIRLELALYSVGYVCLWILFGGETGGMEKIW